jgi:hypothetical protein
MMLHGAATLATNNYDDDEKQQFLQDATFSSFNDSLAITLLHNDGVDGSPRGMCTTA